MKKKTYRSSSGSVCYWISEAIETDRPWMVFLPGLTADHTLFDPQIEHFENRANCFVWDAPAHGASRPYPLDFSLDDMTRILDEIFTDEDIRQPLMVGQSMGGYLAQVYEELYPGRCRGFALVDSAPLKRRYFTAAEILMLEHTKPLYLAIPWKLLLVWGPHGVAATEKGQANMLTMMEDYGKREYCELTAHGYALVAEAIKADRPYDMGQPTILICGEHDNAGSCRRYNREWHRQEGHPLYWIEGAGHNSTIDQPDRVNEILEAFLMVLEDVRDCA